MGGLDHDCNVCVCVCVCVCVMMGGLDHDGTHRRPLPAASPFSSSSSSPVGYPPEREKQT